MIKEEKIRFLFFCPGIGMVIGAILTVFLSYKEIVEADMITKWILAVGVPLTIIFVFLVSHIWSKEVLAEAKEGKKC